MKDVHQTPYGDVRAQGLADLQSNFDTRALLRAVEDLDRFCLQWKRELRDGLLAVHNMAHTVINDAPLSAASGEKACPERRIRLARNSANGASHWLRSSVCWIKSRTWNPISSRFRA